MYEILIYHLLKIMDYDFKYFKYDRNNRLLFTSYLYLIKKITSVSINFKDVIYLGCEICSDINYYENSNIYNVLEKEYIDEIINKIEKLKLIIDNYKNKIDITIFLQLYDIYNYIRDNSDYDNLTIKNKLINLKKIEFDNIKNKYNINSDQIFDMFNNLDNRIILLKYGDS
jgi:hypothetical protein